MIIGTRVKPKTPPVEPGTYLAVCVGIYELGEQQTEFKNKTRYANQIMFTFEIPAKTIEVDGEMKPRQLSRTFAVSASKKGNLRKFLGSWTGTAFTDDAFAAFDTDTLLGSSSHGNAYLVDDGESVLLIECGVSFRRLSQLVRGAGYSVSRLAGCLVSHEHKDHSRCWDKLLEAGVPVYMSHGTMQALGAEGAVPLAPEVGQDVGAPVDIGSWKVLPFRTFHDAREPVGFLLLGADGDRLAFATDTANLRYRFPGLNLLAIEANYWDVILSRQTRMPEQVVRRIRNSHMEIGTLCGYLSSMPLEDCREIFLLHLSDACSDEAWFIEAVRRCVPPQVRVTVCQKGG